MICLDFQGHAALWFDWLAQKLFWMCNETGEVFLFYYGDDYRLMMDMYDCTITECLSLMYEWESIVLY